MRRLVPSLTFALLVSGVHAGSQLWEGSVKLQAPHPVEYLALDASGYAASDNATHDAITKRYVAMFPKEGPGAAKLWPDKTISYCYNTQESSDRLADYFFEATRKWQRAQLLHDVYKYVEAAKPGPDCVNNPQRSKMLVISYNTDGKLETTLGMRSLDSRDATNKGPSMTLSDKTSIGMLDITANIAHEIGHAWGLTHEHQNIYFWLPDLGEGPMSSAPFTEANFNCKALKDYLEVYNRVAKDAPDDVRDLCRSRNVAARHGFSAAEWLPIREQMTLETGRFNRGSDDVDWESIMIYPSGAGGSGEAAPPAAGQALDANDHRQNVLTRRDGSRIKANHDPSSRDVQGIRRLYEDNSFPQGNPVLPNSKESKFFPKFTKMFKKDKC